MICSRCIFSFFCDSLFILLITLNLVLLTMKFLIFQEPIWWITNEGAEDKARAIGKGKSRAWHKSKSYWGVREDYHQRKIKGTNPWCWVVVSCYNLPSCYFFWSIMCFPLRWTLHLSPHSMLKPLCVVFLVSSTDGSGSWTLLVLCLIIGLIIVLMDLCPGCF